MYKFIPIGQNTKPTSRQVPKEFIIGDSVYIPQFKPILNQILSSLSKAESFILLCHPFLLQGDQQ